MIYVIVGDGDMPVREARAIMDDLWNKVDQATPPEDDISIAFLVKNQKTPTPGFKAILDYINTPSSPLPLRLEDLDYSVFWERLQQLTDGKTRRNEPVEVLALFTEEEDNNGLEDFLMEALSEGYPCFELNRQMMELTVTSENDGDIEVPDDTSPETDDLPLGADPVEQELHQLLDEEEAAMTDLANEEGTPRKVYDETTLGRMSRIELQEICKANGYQPRDQRSKQYMIDAILEGQSGEVSNPEPEPEPAPQPQPRRKDDAPPAPEAEGTTPEIPDGPGPYVADEEIQPAQLMEGQVVHAEQLLDMFEGRMMRVIEHALNQALPQIFETSKQVTQAAVIDVMRQVYNISVIPQSGNGAGQQEEVEVDASEAPEPVVLNES
jgi:hypothetical protein